MLSVCRIVLFLVWGGDQHYLCIPLPSTAQTLNIYTIFLYIVLAVHGHRVRRHSPTKNSALPRACLQAPLLPPTYTSPPPPPFNPALAPRLPLRSAGRHPATQPRNPAGAPTCPEAVTAYRPDDGQARSLPPRACCLRVLMRGRPACRGLLAADNARCGAHEGAHAVGQEAGARERGGEGNAANAHHPRPSNLPP